MLNGRFICVRGYEDFMTEGKVYEFVNGRVNWDNGNVFINAESVEHYNFRCLTQIAPYNPTPKDLLTVGRVVELRDGTMGIFINNKLILKDGWFNLSNYDENLNRNGWKEKDVVEIYDDTFDGVGYDSWNFRCGNSKKLKLVSVWQRESKSPQQLEKEAIQIEMEKLAKRLKELEVK